MAARAVRGPPLLWWTFESCRVRHFTLGACWRAVGFDRTGLDCRPGSVPAIDPEELAPQVGQLGWGGALFLDPPRIARKRLCRWVRVVPPTLDARLTILFGLAGRRVHADVLAQPRLVRGVVPVAMQQQRRPDQQVAGGKPRSADRVARVIGISRLVMSVSQWIIPL